MSTPSFSAATATVRVTRGAETPGVSFPLSACTPPDFNPAPLARLTANQPYNHMLLRQVSSVKTIFNLNQLLLAVSSGALPTGLQLTSESFLNNSLVTEVAWYLRGTPTVSGTASFTLAAATAGNSCVTTKDYTPFVCGVSVATTQASYTSNGGPGALTLAANSTDCGWTASTDASWITLGIASGTGSQSVSYTVAAIDATTSAYYWEPAAGYLGYYDLVFVAADGSAVALRVVVVPAGRR